MNLFEVSKFLRMTSWWEIAPQLINYRFWVGGGGKERGRGGEKGRSGLV